MIRNDAPRIAVLGAGPIGLEAAAYARRLGLQVTIYERGRVGEHLQRWGHVRLFSPFGHNSTPVGRAALLADNGKQTLPADGECITGRQHVAAYLEPLARCSLLQDCLKLEHHVVQVGRRGYLKEEGVGDPRRGQQPFRLLVREAKKPDRAVEADVVLDCTGTYGQHRWMGDGGIPAVGEQAAEPHITYQLDDILGERKGHYTSKSVIVVGSGYSAATTVCQLATLAETAPETWTVWLARGPASQPLRRVPSDPFRERDRLALRANTLATRAEGNVEFHPQTIVEAIESAGPDKGYKVHCRCAGKPRTWEADRLVANVGSSPDTLLYRELHIPECFASLGPRGVAAALQQGSTDGLAMPRLAGAALVNPEPQFFILGAKSFGRHSQFLLKTGFDQVRDVFRIITGKTDLDLYQKRG